MTRPYVLIVDDEPDIRALVKEILEDEGFEADTAENADAARVSRRARRPDLILLDIWMPDTDGISLLHEWSQGGEIDTPVVMMSGHGTIDTAVEAIRLGAYDFVEKPLSIAKLLLTVRRGLEVASLRHENVGLRRQTQNLAEPIGRGAVMQSVRDLAARVARHDTPVLITGESGVGKEVLGRYLHNLSPRKDGPFVRVSVASMIRDDAAIELFGLEDGEHIRYGSVERANGGTLFLSDIADMDLSLQAQLLGAIQHQSHTRVAGAEPVQFNIRMVAATRYDLSKQVDAGAFRQDLFYHLNVLPLHAPSLKDHREDIPELLEHYIDTLVTQDGLPYRRISVAGQNRLRNHSWPGNLRELRNVVQRLLILGSGEEVDLAEIEAALGAVPQHTGRSEPGNFQLPLKEAREQFERSYLEHQLREEGGNMTKVASRSGLERTHLYRKLRALGIDFKQVNRAETES